MTDDDVREMKRLYVAAGGKSYSKEIELCDYALDLEARVCEIEGALKVIAGVLDGEDDYDDLIKANIREMIEQALNG